MSASDDVSHLRERLASSWPLFGLKVITPRLTLELPTDPDLVELLGVIDRGIHDPTFMPFLRSWTDEPKPQREQASLAHWWGSRSRWTPAEWHWCGAAKINGQLVGVQDLMAQNFSSLGEVRSGSWLGLEHQGRGIGKEMRAAVLHLAFEGLGATRALSGYFEGNTASQRVSESLGYTPNGFRTVIVRGKPTREFLVVLERTAWEPRRRDDIRIEGLEKCRALFGALPSS